MKISGDNFKALESALMAKLGQHEGIAYEYKQQGLSFKRFAWDLFHASKFRVGDGVGLSGDIIVPDCKDSHIETAIFKALKMHGIEKW